MARLAHPPLPLKILNKLVEQTTYCPQTGVVHRTYKGRTYVINTIHPTTGYIRITCDSHTLQLHRFIWYYMTKQALKEDEFIDHINQDRSDNRWINLRKVTGRENELNIQKKSNLPPGVRRTTLGYYQTLVRLDGRQVCVGSFKTVEEATQNAQRLYKEWFGFELL